MLVTAPSWLGPAARYVARAEPVMQSPMLLAARRAAGKWPHAASPVARMGARWPQSRPSVWLRPVLFTGVVALGSFAASAVVREEGTQSARPSGGRILEATRRFLSQGFGPLNPGLPTFNPVVCVVCPPNNERWEFRASDVSQPPPRSEPYAGSAVWCRAPLAFVVCPA